MHHQLFVNHISYLDRKVQAPDHRIFSAVTHLSQHQESMATIRKRGNKYQVQVRWASPALSRSFLTRRDAELWARQTELQADRKELPKYLRCFHKVCCEDIPVS